MKNYQDFINEEAKLRGNKGVPEEKLREIERQAEREKGIRMDDPRQAGQLGGQIMSLIEQSRRLMFSGKSQDECREIEEKLVDLAKSVMMTEYGDILNNVDLNVKLVPFGEVADELQDIQDIRQRPSEEEQREKAEELEDDEDESDDKDKQKSFFDKLFGSKTKKEKEEFIGSEEYKSGVDVAKLINAIGQGEAKNTKNILHGDEVKNGLRDIFGRSADELFRVWDNTSKVADKLDWVIPIEMKSAMMANQMGGLAGAVQVSWPEAEDQSDEDEKDSDCPSCQSAEDILKNIEEGGSLDDNKEEISDLLSNGNPKINAVGVDFPMLLHEIVKGIYQLIGSAWLPAKDAPSKEVKKAEIYKTATSSFEDEAEDFRYGPYLAAALRDFINDCPNVDRYPNIREYVWGDMCYMARTSEGKEEFLQLFKGILEKTDAAKRKITEMINDIIERIREYEIDQIDNPEDPEIPMREPESEPEVPQAGPEDKEDDIEKLIRQSREKDSEEGPYSKLNKRQLDDELNDALDRGDMKALAEIQKELVKRNESVMLQVYGDEINKILKS